MCLAFSIIGAPLIIDLLNNFNGADQLASESIYVSKYWSEIRNVIWHCGVILQIQYYHLDG